MRYRRVRYRYTVREVGLPQFGDPRSGQHAWPLAEPVFRPPADLFETPDAWVLKVEIAGMDEGAFEIVLYEDALVVAGSRSCPLPNAGARVWSTEIRDGPFRLALPVPGAIDRDRVQARYERGFLYVELPKPQEGPPP